MITNLSFSCEKTQNETFISVKDRAIIGIIADHIVFDRISAGVSEILNSFAPINEDKRMDVKYNGIYLAFFFMDVEDKDLCRLLDDIYFDATFNSEEKRDADELAKHIYMLWLNKIKDFFSTKKAS
ncbi:hypothetical protein [Elizabethkingia anophelis]|uniref:hypothetical protein n=1 Tax=Elizabethkingia anophelis TaxID=1117645 RepID=UPI003892A067